jgi:hypothetical protein
MTAPPTSLLFHASFTSFWLTANIMANMIAKPRMQGAFSELPLELFLDVLDQLVGTSDGQFPIAYEQSNGITRALRALTLVSRNTYLIASRYLYSNSLYLDSCTSYARFRRTLGLDLGNHPQALQYGEAGRNDALFTEAGILRHITSMFISPAEVQRSINDKITPLVRLPQIIDLCGAVGYTLKRLALDFGPIHATPSQVEMIRPHITRNNIFINMPVLEELIVSYDVTTYFRYPPPNLKRLAITSQDLGDTEEEFCFSITSLEVLVFLCPIELSALDIDAMFKAYKGKSLDIVLVDVDSNFCTPRGTRSWKSDDTVRIWEAEVPINFYSDDDPLTLCDSWIWTHGVKGTLWSQEKRRMASWEEVEREAERAGAHDLGGLTNIPITSFPALG